MELTHKILLSRDVEDIKVVYQILKNCGEDMYEKYGLTHWKIPYPFERLINDCATKEVYGVISNGKIIATYQMAYENQSANLTKFAVLPSCSGRGIGSACIKHMEDICRQKGLNAITLDVYNKSIHAIEFYKKNGFIAVGSASTRNFTVTLREKQIK